jgi:hypothetical protein
MGVGIIQTLELDSTRKDEEYKVPLRGIALRRLVYAFPWFHRWVGAFGNTLFFVGSVFFLFADLLTLGTWLFILGSLGMMIDSFAEKLRKYEEELRGRTTSPKEAGQ